VRRAARAVALAFVLLLAGVGPGRAELRRMEGLGAAAIDPGAGGRAAARSAALAAALEDAVLRAALDLIPGGALGTSEAALREAITGQALDYTSRYRIAEDWGERPRLLVPGSEVETEYVLRVEADVDLTRLRARLEALGFVASEHAPQRAAQTVLLVLDPLRSYAALQAVRRALLEELGAGSALPVEFTPARAVLEVHTDRTPAELAEELRVLAPEGLRLVPLASDASSATLRVEEAGAPPATASGPVPASPAERRRFDTPGQNRY
jgi:hypothetical protein